MSEQPTNKTSTGLQENVAGLLCYLGGWITGIVFFLIEKENKVVRFHAMQSIITFGVLTLIGFIPLVNFVIWIIEVVLAIFLMIQTYKGKLIKLPIVGNFAAKQVGL